MELQRVSVKHDAIMNFMVANPTVKLGDVAVKFGVTQGWLSQLIHSQLFQSELAYKKDMAYCELTISVSDRIKNMAQESLRRINERLEINALKTPELLEAAELSLRAMGMLQPKSGAVGPSIIQNNTQINVTTVSKDTLAEARAAMQRGQVIEGLSSGPDRRVEHSNDDRGAQAGQRPASSQEDSLSLPRSSPDGMGVAAAGN